MNVHMQVLFAACVVAPASASFANVYGVCNFYSQRVHFQNGEQQGNHGNDCYSDPCRSQDGQNCGCTTHRAFVPKCQSQKDFDKGHRMWVDVPGKPRFYFWKDDGNNVIYGGTTYGGRRILANLQRMSRVFVHFDGSVTLQEYRGGDNKDFNNDCSGCELSTSIIDVKCKSGGNTCGSQWVKGVSESRTINCDQCSAPNGTKPHCAGSFTVSKTHIVTTTSTSIDELGGSVGISVEAGVDFIAEAKVTGSVSVSYKHTWQDSKSQQVQSTSTESSDCAIDLPAGQKAVASAMMNVGSLHGSLTMTVLRDDKCIPAQKSQHAATVEISDVPMTQAYSSCKWTKESCSSMEAVIV